MDTTTNNDSSDFMWWSILGGAAIAAVLAYGFAAITDLSERLWHGSRPFEPWQADELLVGAFGFMLGGVVLVLRHLVRARREIAALRQAASTGNRPHNARVDAPGYAVRCTLCSSYQLDDGRWGTPGAFIDQRFAYRFWNVSSTPL